MADRFANAIWAYAAYILKTLWPADLAVFYPLPADGHPAWEVALAALLLLGLSAGALRLAERFPPLLVGWLWYLGTLVPVIGLVQVGSQALADRYTYVPLLGIFIAAAWGLAALTSLSPVLRRATPVGAVLALVAAAVVSGFQAGIWAGTETLFAHALQVTVDNALIEGNFGVALDKEGRHAEAAEHLRRAVRLQPDVATLRFDLGVALDNAGRATEALEELREGLRISPDSAQIWIVAGKTYGKLNRMTEAIACLEKAVALDPDSADARVNLGVAMDHAGRTAEALAQFDAALQTRPHSFDALFNKGAALGKLGRLIEAIACFEKAAALEPDRADIRINLGMALDFAGRRPEALEQFREVLRRRPGDPAALEHIQRIQSAIQISSGGHHP
jgi:tetratricopeptide (TPR) repeat protein